VQVANLFRYTLGEPKHNEFIDEYSAQKSILKRWQFTRAREQMQCVGMSRKHGVQHNRELRTNMNVQCRRGY
jgi:hypothetical protein